MKKVVALLGTLLILTLYTFAVSVGNSYVITSTAATYPSTSAKEHCASTISPNLFHATSQAGSLVTLFNNTFPTTVKDSFDEFAAFVNLTEELFINEFSQYTCIWRNFLIKMRKADLIFPFDYFW